MQRLMSIVANHIQQMMEVFPAYLEGYASDFMVFGISPLWMIRCPQDGHWSNPLDPFRLRG